MKMEWRLRQIERAHQGSGSESEGDVLWLVHELRQTRDALLRILARCQDADSSNELSSEIKFRVNEALGLYDAGDEKS
jgi:hypothetical protein